MLRDVDFNPLRAVLGIAFAASAAFYLISSLGKPPDWTPGSYQRLNVPRLLWGRDRVRAWAIFWGAFGLIVAVYFGLIAR